MNMKRVLALLLALTMVLSLTACGKKDVAEVPQEQPTAAKEEPAEQILRYGVMKSPGSIDPTNLKDIFSYEMVRQSYNGLTDRTPDGKTIPGLAKSWEAKDGGKVYHFVLEQGVKFHSGNELKASDVKFTFEYAIDPTRDGGGGSSFLSGIVGYDDVMDGKTKELAGFKIINDYEFEIEFTEPEIYFPEYCSVESLYIIEQAAVEGKGENWWETMSAGTGPYKLEEFSMDEKTVFVAHEDYFRGKPGLNRLEFIVVPEEETAMMMYQNEELDVIEAPWGQLDLIKEDADLSKELVEYPIADATYLGMTQALYEPFKDIRVRQAISLVISPDDMAKKIMQDTVYPLYGVIPVGFSVYDKNIKPLEYNPEQARELLKEAGYDANNPLPPITLSYVPMDEDNAVYIAEQLKKELNWEVKLESPDFSALLSDLLDRKVQFYIFGSTASYGDARSIMYTAFHSSGKRNFSDYNNPNYDNPINEAAKLSSQEERGKLYLQAEKALMDDFGCVPMYSSKAYLLVKPYVKDMKISGLGMDTFDTINIEK